MVETQSRHSPPDCDDDKLIDLEVEQIKLKQHELEKIESTHEADDKKKKKKEDKKKEPSVMPHKLFRYASKFDLLAVILAAIGSIAIGALQPVAIIIFGDFLADFGSSITNVDMILENTIDMILIFVYIGTGILVGGYCTHALWVISGENQAKRIRQLYIHSILRQDMTWFDKSEEGSLTTRLATDTQMIQEGISEKLGLVIQLLAQVIAGFVIAFVKGWRLAVVILATVPVMAIVGGLMGIYYTKFTKTAQDSYAQAGSIAEQVFSGIRTVYAFSLQDRFSERYDKELDKACATGIRRGIVMGVQMAAFIFVLFCTYGLSFWYGAKLVDEGTLTGGVVLIAFFAMLIGTMSLLSLPMNLSAVASACGAAYRIFEIIDRVPDIDPDSPEGIKDGKLTGQMEFNHIKFAYPTRPDIQVLKDFSSKVQPGQTIALVGSSGSGKSTIVQLLQRFYDALDGDILLDGKSIKEYNVKWLRQQIGVVSQEPVLFNMSVRKNLLMGATGTVSDEEIIAACKKANCHSFISQLPHGYDTLVGQQGSMLSGGQKQRVAIARAIIKNPSILLLDEATSALDTKSERIVQQALDVASENRTTLMIAHRLSTIRNADMIIVMKQGEVVEQGSHSELIEKNGTYADLVHKQLIALEQEEEQEKSDDSREYNVTPVDYDSVIDEKEEIRINLAKRPSIVSSLEDVGAERRREIEQERKWKTTKTPFYKVLMEMKPEWHLISLGVLGGVLSGTAFPLSGLLIALCITVMIDPTVENIMPAPMEGANLYSFLFLIVGITSFIGIALQIAAFETAGERYTRRLRSRIFKAFMKQEVAFYDEEDNNTGALTSMLALDAKNVNEIISKIVGEISSIISTGVTGFVIAFVYSWILSLIVLGCVPFLVIGAAYESKIEMNFEDDTKKASIQTGEVAGEAIKTIRTVASLTKQDYFEKTYEKAGLRPHKLALRKAYLGSVGFALSQGMIMYVYAIAFYASIRLVGIGKINMEQMMVTLMAMMITAFGIGRSSALASGIAKAKYAALSAFEILERQPSIDPDLEGIEPTSVQGHVKCENISFTYPARPDVPIFSGEFDFTGMAGKTIALVGASGCGKSTTIALLERWYDSLSGVVRLDEQNVQNYTLGNLRSHMALVSQEPVLFDLSIEENIRFGVPNNHKLTEDDIVKACNAANIHRFVSSLPHGYNTRVGDKGSQLSGGQKQRIAIARALLRNPRVLLLDEATSALDSESEKLVQSAIDNVLQEGGRTTITIAHRLSTIQNADLICVIDKGRIVEQGTHWELLKLDGLYNTLVHEQSLNVS
ncbi:P-loop containing nucleoside triphosphate hydrolase protein [Circinella umbellata]|nr:P-loop containing nucleoside triphosphate hydrolase protein [Circinella umbellata]